MFRGHLHLRLGEFSLDSGDFAFETSGITALFGRSGAGKTTLLRAMAGLERRTRGTLTFAGETWQEGAWARSPEKRDIGMVFQHSALLGNRTVAGNLDFAAKRAPRGRIPLQEVIARTGIEPLLTRSVTHLSGGERQRVAVARALVGQPRVLMMDEPLAALDWAARAELLRLFESVIREFSIPTLLITHNPLEVERLADRVMFMAGGRIERIENLADALNRVDSPLFWEGGTAASLQGHAEPVAGDPYQLKFITVPAAANRPAVVFWLPHDGSACSGGRRRLRVRAADVALSRTRVAGISVQNQMPARVERIEPAAPGRMVVFMTLADGQRLASEITLRAAGQLQLQPGEAVTALIKSAALLG